MKKIKKRLREGFTTGTCAAIAAKASVKMLFEPEDVVKESILTPKGVTICTEIYDIKRTANTVSCAVKKDAGDDPDVTNGILIYAKAELSEGEEIAILGGEGVGTVTKAGLSQDIGEAAINPVPKKMILKEVKEVLDKKGYIKGCKITIEVPEGREIARRTFNPRLGIVDGISILGTTGIVEPMSERALIESIAVEMNVAKANGVKDLILTPGNYGEEFIRDTLKIDLLNGVKISNYVGEGIDLAVEKGFESILLVGHVGKLVKLAAGIMNTHSHQADGRMEVFASHAALQGASKEIVREMMDSVTTDEVIRILKQNNLYDSTMESILEKVEYHLKQRCYGELPIGAILFSKEHGILGMTKEAERLVQLKR